jgi:DUF2939 family protein
MGKLFKLIILIALIVGAYAFITPYRTVQHLTQALENEDPALVDQYVDFDAVKSSFQDDFAKRMGIDTDGNNNIASTLATGIAGTFINSIVSPDMMVTVLKDKDRRDNMGLSATIGDLLSRGRWIDAHNFVLSNDDGKPTALLRRTGLLRWEVVALRIS